MTEVKERKCKKKSPDKSNKPKKNLKKPTNNYFDWSQVYNYALGTYYRIVHWIIMILGGCVLLFDTNPWRLTILLTIITLDGISNVLLHDCPLTMYEKKYLNTSLSEERKQMWKRLKIPFDCEHVYESQLEVITNLWTMCAAKICIIILNGVFAPLTYKDNITL